MNSSLYCEILGLLKRELVPALGCTEPSAIALASALAKETLHSIPLKMDIYCSSSVIKNVHSVCVPNSGGMKGVEAAAALGVIGGDSKRSLEVLESVTSENILQAKKMLEEKIIKCYLALDKEDLYILVKASTLMDSCEIEICGCHSKPSRIVFNGKVVFSEKNEPESSKINNSQMKYSLNEAYEFSTKCDITDVKPLINMQINCNWAIAVEGMSKEYGIGEGYYSKNSNIRELACSMPAAGSDARMNGCPLPVVINSGSGNQGLTVSLPVVVYAKELKVTEEETIRALVFANLIALLQKRYIGSLSAFCGAVCAAAGAACGICMLKKGTLEQISNTLSYCLGTIGGMVCDGAKSSCASKIHAALEVALHGMERSLQGFPVFKSGDGLIQNDINSTIESVGRLGKIGMAGTNTEILNIILENR